VTQDETTVRSDIVVNNPNPIGIAVGSARLELTVRLNDVVVGHGESADINLDRGESSTTVVTTFSNSRLTEWWASHLADGEHTDWDVDVRLATSMFGRGVSARVLDVQGQFETSLLQQIEAVRPPPLMIGGYGVEFVETDLEWGDSSAQKSSVEGRLMVKNNTPVDVTVSRLGFDLVMNDVIVGHGETQPDQVIAASQTSAVTADMEIDHSAMVRWWPTHIAEHEQSTLQARVSVVVEAQLPQPIGAQRLESPVIVVTDSFKTDLLDLAPQ
jgi:LEA14-like dessication related protein